MGKYISINWSREKIRSKNLDAYIPYRTKTVNGKKVPNFTSKISMSSEEMNRSIGKVSDGNWTEVKIANTGEVIKKLVAASISIATENCLTNHVFSKGDQAYLQPYSGVIGLDLMRCLAEIYMLRWIHKLKNKITLLSQLPVVKINDEAEEMATNILEQIWERVNETLEKNAKRTPPKQNTHPCDKCNKPFES